MTARRRQHLEARQLGGQSGGLGRHPVEARDQLAPGGVDLRRDLVRRRECTLQQASRSSGEMARRDQAPDGDRRRRRRHREGRRAPRRCGAVEQGPEPGGMVVVPVAVVRLLLDLAQQVVEQGQAPPQLGHLGQAGRARSAVAPVKWLPAASRA